MTDDPQQVNNDAQNTEDPAGSDTADDALDGMSIYDIIEQQNAARATETDADKSEEIVETDTVADPVAEVNVEAVEEEAGTTSEMQEAQGSADLIEPDDIDAEPEFVEHEAAPVASDEEAVLDDDDDGVTITVQTVEVSEAETEHEDTTSEVEITQPDPEPPAEPEWKVRAREIYEEREAKKREMFASRRNHEQSWLQARREEEAQLRLGKQEADARLRRQMDADEHEKQSTLDDMMETLRQERERKQREREAMDRKLRQERESRSYLNHRNQPSEPEPEIDVSPAPPARASAPPPAPKPARDLEERLSRLSKPEPNPADQADDPVDDDA